MNPSFQKQVVCGHQSQQTDFTFIYKICCWKQSRTHSLTNLLCNRFEWPIAMSDVASHTIELMVKNSIGVFSNRRVNMGQLLLDLSQFDDLTKASTEWYALIRAFHFIFIALQLC